MMTLVIVVHVIACVILIGLVLVQRGRGAGLVESFSGVESMFGTKTPEILTKLTTVLSVVFFISCLSLAIFSVKQSRSLMRNVAPEAPAASADAPLAVTEQKAAQAKDAVPAAAPAATPVAAPVQAPGEAPKAQ